jgi:cation:H+ antiporter
VFYLALELLIAIVALILGLMLMFFSSDKAVEHLISFASSLGVSMLMIGLILASVGTDLPEIANDIMSSALGHGDITIGDSFGSILTQISLVVGLLPFLAGTYKVHRKRCVIIGGCEIVTLTLAVSIAGQGYISRISGFFFVVIWLISMLIIRKVMEKNGVEKKKSIAQTKHKRALYHLAAAILGFIGVAIGAYIMIRSVIVLSEVFQISEYIISFFLVAIGTSLPELVVEIAALRKKQYALAIGDAIGSCIVDATLSVGVGPLIFPITVSGKRVVITGFYAILVSIIVISALNIREKHDRKAGAFFIILYLLSYMTLYLM